MKILAYTAQRYANVTQEAIGGQGIVLTCPPVTDTTLQPAWFYGNDLVVFNLHGLPNTPAWFGDDGVAALTAQTLALMDLRGAGVFAINCYLGDANHPMRDALQLARADWLVAGAGQNWAGHTMLEGADKLLQWFMRFWQRGMTPESSLEWAKRVMYLTPQVLIGKARHALEDASQFQLWRWTA